MPKLSHYVIWFLATVAVGVVTDRYLMTSIEGSWYFKAGVKFIVLATVGTLIWFILSRLWAIYLNRRKERVPRGLTARNKFARHHANGRGECEALTGQMGHSDVPRRGPKYPKRGPVTAGPFCYIGQYSMPYSIGGSDYARFNLIEGRKIPLNLSVILLNLAALTEDRVTRLLRRFCR